MRCKSCEMVSINGIPCHETGCPDAWKDYARECKWCGRKFLPEGRKQECCGDNCAIMHANWQEIQLDISR